MWVSRRRCFAGLCKATKKVNHTLPQQHPQLLAAAQLDALMHMLPLAVRLIKATMQKLFPCS